MHQFAGGFNVIGIKTIIFRIAVIENHGLQRDPGLQEWYPAPGQFRAQGKRLGRAEIISGIHAPGPGSGALRTQGYVLKQVEAGADILVQYPGINIGPVKEEVFFLEFQGMNYPPGNEIQVADGIILILVLISRGNRVGLGQVDFWETFISPDITKCQPASQG